MNPAQVILWQCANCQQYYTNADGAARCCHCYQCGAPAAKYPLRPGTRCDACREASRAARIRNVPESLYGEREVAMGDDAEAGLCGCVAEYCEYHDHPEGCDGVHGAWAVVWSDLELDADGILDNALENHHEDARDEVDFASLQTALDEWLEDNPVRSFYVDETTRVVPDDACRAPVDAIEAFARWLAAEWEAS